MLLCGGTGAQASNSDVLNHFDSTRQRKLGILMEVHVVEFLEGSGRVIPSLSNPIQVNTKKLLDLHT